jgi:hypothetical protein
MNPELRSIVDNPAISAEQRQALQRKGVGTSDPASIHDQTLSMLRALGKERIEDLTDADFQKYVALNGNRYSDPVIAESANWIAPDDTWLRLLGWGDERGWWNHVLDKSIAANRPDVQSYARRKLAELDRQP